MKRFLEKIYAQAVDLNHRNIFDLFDKNKEAIFLDLGCDDGELTRLMAKSIGTSRMYGVEIIEERVKKSQENGVEVKNFDLNKNFDFEDGSVDVVHANQVIEHICNSDNFLSEIYRILKPGGYAVISTENGSSWCNIFASVLGWQIFSLTNFSNLKHGIGNPLALRHDGGVQSFDSWNHVRIYNIRGLKEYCEVFGFRVEEVRGAGYFPFPGFFGNLDTTHCHFMTLKIRK